MNIELSMVIPFYNEEENVEDVCHDLTKAFKEAKINYEIIAIDNGSHDKTAQLLVKLAKENPQIKIVTVKVNQGYGWGITRGMLIAKGDYIGYMPGDGQIAPRDVLRVFNKMKQEDWDFGQGKRINKIYTVTRKVSSIGFKFLFQLFFPCPITDMGSNPKIMKRWLYKKINPVSKDWFIDSEIIINSSRLTKKLGELPYRFKRRRKGKTHIKFGTVFEMLKNMIKWKIKFMKESLQKKKK